MFGFHTLDAISSRSAEYRAARHAILHKVAYCAAISVPSRPFFFILVAAICDKADRILLSNDPLDFGNLAGSMCVIRRTVFNILNCAVSVCGGTGVLGMG